MFHIQWMVLKKKEIRCLTSKTLTLYREVCEMLVCQKKSVWNREIFIFIERPGVLYQNWESPRQTRRVGMHENILYFLVYEYLTHIKNQRNSSPLHLHNFYGKQNMFWIEKLYSNHLKKKNPIKIFWKKFIITKIWKGGHETSFFEWLNLHI